MRDGLATGAPTAQTPKHPLPHSLGTAKQVIFLFMQGGPSHLETFDPKPVLQRMDGEDLPQSFKNIDLAQTNTATGKLLGQRFHSISMVSRGWKFPTGFPV